MSCLQRMDGIVIRLENVKITIIEKASVQKILNLTIQSSSFSLFTKASRVDTRLFC